MFDTVSFTYPSGVRALRNVSFEVSRGETLAIVGENGAGKTTIAKLICGFFKPTAGTIHIAGADTPNLDVESVRHTTGAVFQDYAKYPWTLRENVLLNGRTGPDADQRIDAAFLRVGLDLQVPYDRTLGRTYGGIEPSGGTVAEDRDRPRAGSGSQSHDP